MYLDDILIPGKSEGEHLATLEEVLQTCRSWTASQKRKVYFSSSFSYLHGIRIVSQELHSAQWKYVPYKMLQGHTTNHHWSLTWAYCPIIHISSKDFWIPCPHCIICYTVLYSGNRESKTVGLLNLQSCCLHKFWCILTQCIPLL